LVLSDLGASIDKVEDPHVGDYLRVFPPLKQGLSGRFNALNRDKRSIAIDLKHTQGPETLRRLLPRYDVVVESFRPGVMERLGLGYEAMRAANPRIILCSISGYGQTGPLSQRAGHDLNYVSVAGVLGSAGPADGPPAVPPMQLADIAGGALFSAVGILAALYEAKSSGTGRHLDVSMCEGSLAFLIPELGNLDATGTTSPRGAELLTGGSASYSVYRTKDDRFLSVAPLEPKFYLAFNQAIGRPADLSELIQTPELQAKVRREIQAILATKTRDEWETIFAGQDVCVEPILDAAEVLAHKQHTARRMFYRIGDLHQVRTPFGTTEGHRPPPKLGEHTDTILTDAGLTAAEIATLRSSGTFGSR
jgi:crotonobetainyl-CoA:carnitine CoA-transferase CaiB-like acyl-CoA transferase